MGAILIARQKDAPHVTAAVKDGRDVSGIIEQLERGDWGCLAAAEAEPVSVRPHWLGCSAITGRPLSSSRSINSPSGRSRATSATPRRSRLAHNARIPGSLCR